MTDDTVKCWGNNGLGQLGDGTTTDRPIPVPVSGLSGAIVIGLAAGENHTCALISGGTVKCWGDNQFKQLGNGTASFSATPVAAGGSLAGVSAIAAGENHTCALVSGAVKCWGKDDHSQLGDGLTVDNSTPQTVAGVTAVAIAAGEGHTCALLGDATVRCWGWNNNGQLGNASNLDSLTPVVAGTTGVVTAITAGATHTCALISGGTIQCWGYGLDGELGNGTTSRNTPISVTGLGAAAASISAGDAYTCATLVGGGVKCWGANHSGQLGNGLVGNSSSPVTVALADPSDVSSISAGGSHTCALFGNGSVDCWGANWDGQLGDGSQVFTTSPVSVLGLTGITAVEVATGGYHTCARFSDGSVKCWGANWYGQLGDGTNTDRTTPVSLSLTGASALAAGEYHTCAIVTGGVVECWGLNDYGQLGNNSKVSSTTPVVVGLGTTATAIAAGDEFTCALLTDKSVKCWGQNSYGQLGNGVDITDGLNHDSQIPVAVSSLTDATSITLGGFHACSLRTGGTVVCWGANWDGQLGNGANINVPGIVYSSTPAAVETSMGVSLDSVSQVAAGSWSTCALITGGTLKCWGADGYGQLGDGLAASNSRPVSVTGVTTATSIGAGGWHNCAVITGGTARCWGYNNDGQVGDGTVVNRSAATAVLNLTNAVAVEGGKNHSCALLADATVACWGYNAYAQLGNGRTLYSTTPVEVLHLGSPPGPPTGVHGTYANASVQVSWAAPASTGGKPITGYTVSSTPASTGCTTTGPTTCLVSGLTNGQTYKFKVTAQNEIGTGAPSDESTGVVPVAVPGQATGVTGVAHNAVRHGQLDGARGHRRFPDQQVHGQQYAGERRLHDDRRDDMRRDFVDQRNPLHVPRRSQQRRGRWAHLVRFACRNPERPRGRSRRTDRRERACGRPPGRRQLDRSRGQWRLIYHRVHGHQLAGQRRLHHDRGP